MKKSLITLIVLVLLGVGIYFIIGIINSNPPEPTITDYGHRILPPLPSFLPLNDREFTNKCQVVYQLKFN